jgi:arylsulfatase A-like enzyme
MEDRGLDGGRGNLNRNWVPMAAALKPAGYMSYAAGKWHVEPVQPTQHPAGTLSSPRLAGAECQGCETAFDFPAGPGTMRALSLRLP